MQAQGPHLPEGNISHVAICNRSISMGNNTVAFSAGTRIHLWESRARREELENARPYSPPIVRDRDEEREESHLQFDLTVTADAVLFING